MKNITKYIFEKLQVWALTNRDKTLSELFNKDVHPSVSVVDLKDGDEGCILRISLEDATVLDQWTCPCTFYRDSVYNGIDGGLGEQVGVKWMSDDCSDPKSLKKYATYDMITRISCLDLKDNKQREGVDLTAWVVSSSNRWVKGYWSEEWILVLIPNKENKDKFIKWFKEAHDDGTLQKFADDLANKRKTEDEEDKRKAKEIEAKMKKKRAKANPSKPIEQNLEDLYGEVQSNSEGTVSGLADIKKAIKNEFSKKLKLSDKEIEDIFGKYIDNVFEIASLVNGPSTDLENTFFDTWGNKSYSDCLPGWYEHKGKGDYDYVTASWGIDKNGIFMVMFEDEGDNNLIFMTYED